MMNDQELRNRMVDSQIIRRGVNDPKVLAAMRKVPRPLFLPPDARKFAYADNPIRIGNGQTISQPYIVAFMTELLHVQPEDIVLDVGTGSGYQAAILGELALEVHTIERFASLAVEAEKTLASLGYTNVHVHIGDGTKGYPPEMPYDRILVGAAAPDAPESLKMELADGGRLVIPVGTRFSQHLEIWDRSGDDFRISSSIPVVFVPLVGEEGWKSH
jgi:protein-L-isoaspartate(D-aspartate) O-methyltransferase